MITRRHLKPTIMRVRLRIIAVILTLCCSGVFGCASFALEADPARASDATKLGAAEQQFFEKQVRPLLIRHCYECHSSQAKVLKGSLRLDSRAGWMKGGDSGPAGMPGAVDVTRVVVR